MFRKTITIFSLLGLILSLGLWVVSYWGVEAKCPSPRFTVHLGSGAAFIGDWAAHIYIEPIREYRISRGRFHGFSTRWWPSCNLHREDSFAMTTYWKIVVPLWIPTLGCGLSFFFLYRRGRERARRVKRGLCFQCGYDLRGSSVRCPECGTGFPKHKGSSRRVRETAA